MCVQQRYLCITKARYAFCRCQRSGRDAWVSAIAAICCLGFFLVPVYDYFVDRHVLLIVMYFCTLVSPSLSPVVAFMPF